MSLWPGEAKPLVLQSPGTNAGGMSRINIDNRAPVLLEARQKDVKSHSRSTKIPAGVLDQTFLGMLPGPHFSSHPLAKS